MRQTGKNRGAALITVLVAMMIITLMVLEFQYSAIIERQLAYNDLHQLQAYYLAKAGARMGLLRVNLYARGLKESSGISKNLGNINIKPYLELIWSLPLPAFPPEKASLTKLLKADKDAAEKVLSETQISDGQYSQVITSESAKINLNYLVVPKGLTDRPNLDNRVPAKSLFEHVGRMLLALLENMIKESQDPYEEFGNLRPEELVYDIMDWVSPGDVRLAGGAKDQYYETQVPPYKAKRNRFYTLDELKMVRGIDDFLFNKLRPHVTVYSYDGKINLNGASDTVLKAIFPDFTEDDLKKLNEEKAKRGGSWLTEKDFVDYVTQTLGRSSFTTLFPNAAEYPFSVNSQSFAIESLGVIKKSKSAVTRLIKIGVALRNTSANTGQSVANTQDECGKLGNNYFWRGSIGQCYMKPSNADECAAVGGLGPAWDEATKTCMISEFGGQMAVTLPAGAATSTAKSAPPNAVKVLYWTES